MRRQRITTTRGIEWPASTDIEKRVKEYPEYLET